MSDPIRCKRCGGLIPQAGALSGRCPRCMVELGLESKSDTAFAARVEAQSMVGRQLGHYRVLALAGAGGMGAVWKARDTRLDRDVALKTLPEEFAHENQLLRFEREAKVLASLNHPNIAAIHGLEEDQGRRFLVLEFVEGETLADRIHRGAIPLDESLKLARQIADALEAAHEKGIIHRDLKPANIKITTDGVVKVLDFGLAKAFAGEEVRPDSAGSRESSLEATEAGLILGTAAYMAPEQARGKRVDKRADIWAFGAVLYEMVTGRRAFAGSDPTETMASAVTKEPDLDHAPVGMQRLLRKCLEKDPKNRLRDIGDAWELVNEPTVPADALDAKFWRRVSTLAGILFSVLGIAVLRFWLTPRPLPEVFTLPAIQAPLGSRLPLGTPAISSDERYLAYTVTDPKGVTRVFVRDMKNGDLTVLPGSEGAVHPFWFPRRDSLAFAVGLKLKSINLAGSSPRYLSEIDAEWQGSWSENGNILVKRGPGLSLVSPEGGPPTPIPNSTGAAFPEFLPDDRRFLVRLSGEGGGSIQLATLGSTQRTIVLNNVQSAPVLAMTPGGRAYLLYVDGADLMAQEFDRISGKVVGQSVVVLVPRIGIVGNPAVRPAVGVSPRILAYQKADDAMTRRLKLVDRTGKTIRTFSPELLLAVPRLSPDGSRAVGTQDSGGVHIWVTDLEREVPRRKTFDGAIERFPVWSSDGTRLAFLRQGKGIFAMDADGDREQRLTAILGTPTSWWGQDLLYISEGKIYLLDLAHSKTPTEVWSLSGNSRSAQFSPDGNYIAFDSDGSGRYEVYVQPTALGGRVTPVSRNGGAEPRWSDKELFFVSSDGDLMAVEFKFGDGGPVGAPKKLFHFQGRGDYFGKGYDVTHDGQRFLIVSESDMNDFPITVVLNWWVDLERRIGLSAYP